MHCCAEQPQRGDPQLHLGLVQPMREAVEEACGSKAASWWLGPQPLPQVEHGTYVIVLPVSTITANFLAGVPRYSVA